MVSEWVRGEWRTGQAGEVGDSGVAVGGAWAGWGLRRWRGVVVVVVMVAWCQDIPLRLPGLSVLPPSVSLAPSSMPSRSLSAPSSPLLACLHSVAGGGDHDYLSRESPILPTTQRKPSSVNRHGVRW